MARVSYMTGIAPFLSIGWRNMWRQKRRSLVVISSVAIGISAMILLNGFMNGLTMQMTDNTINTVLGHVALHRKGFRKNIKLENTFLPSQQLYSALRGEGSLSGYAPRVTIKGMIRTGEGSRGVLIQGIDPAREKGVSKIYNSMIKKEGRYLPDTSSDGILISKTLAEKLDVYIDDRVVLMFQDRNNELVGAGLRVCGFFETPMGGFDRGVVFVGIRKLQELSGLGDAVSEIVMSTKDLNAVEKTRQRLLRKITDPALEVQTWMDMAPDLVSAIRLQESMMIVIFLIVFITVIFSIANTLIMSIIERFHELGVMKSIGTRPSRVFFIVMYEAMSLGLLGLLMGLAISIPVVALLGHTGMDFSFAVESMRKWGTGNVIYPVLLPRDIVTAACIVFFTTFIAALYPALKAARIKPLDALNYL
jgi:putative ABC transport system permease protein